MIQGNKVYEEVNLYERARERIGRSNRGSISDKEIIEALELEIERYKEKLKDNIPRTRVTINSSGIEIPRLLY